MMAPTDFPIEVARDAGFWAGPGIDLVVQIVAGLVIAGLSFLFGFNRGRDTYNLTFNNTTIHIYDTIKKAIAKASNAQRDSVIGAARDLQSVTDKQLGGVLSLADGLSDPYEALDAALKGKMPKAGHKPPHVCDPDPACAAGPGGIEKLVINARRVVLNTAPATDSAGTHGGEHGRSDDRHEAAHGHGDGHTHGHDEAHHAPLMDAATQVAAVRSAVDALADHWSEKESRLAELRRARADLNRTPDAKQNWSFDKGR